MEKKRVVAVVLGAGQGTRMGAGINKIFLGLRGKPVILYSIQTFERTPGIDEILLISATGEESRLRSLVEEAGCKKVRAVICGGATRHGSEQCALEALRPEIEDGAISLIMIHDGARPFLSVAQVEVLIAKTRQTGGAMLAAPLVQGERIVQMDEAGQINATLSGAGIWKAQTPQSFEAQLLLRAYDLAAVEGFIGTDTASSIERYGGQVAIVESNAYNLKLTTPHDLLVAEKLLDHGLLALSEAPQAHPTASEQTGSSAL